MDKRDFLKEYQPLHDQFEQMGMGGNYFFQALAHMGDASHQMAWANTVLADLDEVPSALKEEMKSINQKIGELQEKLRVIEKHKDGKNPV